MLSRYELFYAIYSIGLNLNIILYKIKIIFCTYILNICSNYLNGNYICSNYLNYTCYSKPHWHTLTPYKCNNLVMCERYN